MGDLSGAGMMSVTNAVGDIRFPAHRDLYYAGGWHAPLSAAGQLEVFNPATGESLGAVSVASAVDVDRAVAGARAGFQVWRNVVPLERAKLLRHIAAVIRQHGRELALLDAVDCGNPVTAMAADV